MLGINHLQTRKVDLGSPCPIAVSRQTSRLPCAPPRKGFSGVTAFRRPQSSSDSGTIGHLKRTKHSKPFFSFSTGLSCPALQPRPGQRFRDRLPSRGCRVGRHTRSQACSTLLVGMLCNSLTLPLYFCLRLRSFAFSFPRFAQVLRGLSPHPVGSLHWK